MGITVAAKEHGFEAVNLDLQPSNNGLFVSLSATGETSLLTDKRRMAAKSKDLICVSGSLGAAFLGLQVMERGAKKFEESGEQPDMNQYQMLVGAYLRPELDAERLGDRLGQGLQSPRRGHRGEGGAHHERRTDQRLLHRHLHPDRDGADGGGRCDAQLRSERHG